MNMKKRLQMLLALALCLALLGCGQEGTSPSPSATDGAAQTTASGEDSKTETIPATTEDRELTKEEQMIEDSLISTGNNYRFRKVVEKAKAGEDVTIAFIGGSITEGYNAGTTEIYAKLTYDYFAATYGTGENVHYVNAGLSGTPSLLGLIRSDRDIFSSNPDIVFVEFAVNDGDSAEDVIGFENLLRKALLQDNEPAVFVLYSVTKEGYNAQASMAPITWNYDLPSVSVKSAIWSSIEDGSFSWSDWSNDEAHPNAAGQLLYSKFIIHLMEAMLAEEPDTSYDVSLKSFKAKDYVDTTLVDREYNTDWITITEMGDWQEKQGGVSAFSKGWYLDKGAENDTMTFTFTGKALFLIYKDNAEKSKYGTIEVMVDGEGKRDIDASTSDGWGNPVPTMIYSGKEAGEHTVTISLKDGEEGDFAILGFGVCP